MARFGLRTSILGAMAEAMEALAGRLRAIAGPTEATIPSAAEPGDSPGHGAPPEHWLALVRRGAPQLLREGAAQTKDPSGPVFQMQPRTRPTPPRTPPPAPAPPTPLPHVPAHSAAEAVSNGGIAASPRRPAASAQAEATGADAFAGPAQPATTEATTHSRHADALSGETELRHAFDPARHARPPAFPVPLAGPASLSPARAARTATRDRGSAATAAEPADTTVATNDVVAISPQASPAPSGWPQPSAAEPSPGPADEVACPWPCLPDEDEPLEDADRHWPRLPDEGGQRRGRGWNA